MMIKKLLLFFLIVMFAMYLAACSSYKKSEAVKSQEKVMKETISEMPSWYKSVPTDKNHLYSAQTTTSQDLQMAVDKAKQSAAADIARQMEIKIEALFRRFQEETGLGQNSQFLNESTNVSQSVLSTVLIGCKEKDKKIINEGGIYRAYVLMQMPIGQANKELVKRLKENEYIYTHVRATEAYQELERQVERLKKSEY